MLSIDLSHAQWLAVAGVAYDIVGALMLARALMWARPQDLAAQTESRWAGNADLLKALCEQTNDAKWGSILFVLGFVLQAASSAGVKLDLVCLLMLGVLLLAVIICYLFGRPRMVRASYMRAIDALAGDAEDKRIMREAFPP
jgi:hypothetical protein